jgi:hypothetical protein
VRDLGLSNLADPQWRWYTRVGADLRLGETTEQRGRGGVYRPQRRSITLSQTLHSDTCGQTVELVGQPMRFGGVRWWFLCPNCSRRRTALYLPTAAGARRWGCRQCYGLTYLTQRLDPIARLEVRMRRVASRLRSLWAASLDQQTNDSLDFQPSKPKWMRWTTYERRCALWYKAADGRNRAWLRGVQSFLTRIERSSGERT